MELGRWRRLQRSKSAPTQKGRRLRFDAAVGVVPAPHISLARRERPRLDDDFPGDADEGEADDRDAA